MEIINNFSISDSRQLTFIDTNLDDYQGLIPEENSTEVILLDSSRDGIAQITKTLGTRSDIASIHIISHGNDAQLQLGNIQLNDSNLQNYAPELQSWRHALTENIDILVYSCNVASTAIGQDFKQ